MIGKSPVAMGNRRILFAADGTVPVNNSFIGVFIFATLPQREGLLAPVYILPRQLLS
jgi:hypothetical protein